MDGGNTSNYDDGNIRNYNINAVYKSTVVLPCHVKMNTNPIWLQNQLELNSKVCVLKIVIRPAKTGHMLPFLVSIHKFCKLYLYTS